jgi:hypothetical protein
MIAIEGAIVFRINVYEMKAAIRDRPLQPAQPVDGGGDVESRRKGMTTMARAWVNRQGP